MMRASFADNLMFMREVYWAVSRRLLLLLALLIVAGMLLLMRLPIPPTYAGRVLENAGHTPLFIAITLALMLVLRSDLKLEGVRLYALAGLLGAGGGLLSEVLQVPFHRDASWEDVFADATGVACALALFAFFDRRNAISKPWRFGLLTLALVCIAAHLTPVVRMTGAYLYRNHQFPVIADYRNSTELRWIVSFGVNRDIDRGALDVDFEGDGFPGVSLYEPVPDWRKYRWLVIDVANSDAQKLGLGVRVHDQGHGTAYADRFNRVFDLEPGRRRQIRISLEDIRHGPRERLMDMGHISDITLFRGKPASFGHVRIYSLRLE
jgi:hypothetical protein